MIRICVSVTVGTLLFTAGSAAASKLDDEIDRRLRGAWAIVAGEIYSSCSGTYSDNRVGAAGIASKADHRFDLGELVKIDKIKVKRARVDLLVTLGEPILVPWTDGPFELYDERECKAQLIFELGRDLIKSGDADAVLAEINGTLTTFPNQTAAVESPDWNQRERDPYPPDYDRTLARYEVWKAEQTNAAVTAGIHRSVTEAADAADEIEDDPEYLAGFAAGAEKMQNLYLGDCSQLVEATYRSSKKSPPSGKSSAWKRGFSDGQRVVFHTSLARELRDCYVPVPRNPVP